MDTGLKRGTCRDVNSIMSVTMRTAGSGGQIHSFCAMNSLSMSFCMVPPIRSHVTPCLSAMARYMASATDAVQLIVIEVVTSPSGMSAKSRSKSFRVEIDTPSLPTSPRARGWSASYPIRAGISNAVERPVCPCSSRNLNRALVSSGRPKPANMRIVHSRPRYIVGYTPRVNGYCPGWPRSEERRVGKECRSRWSADALKKKKDKLHEEYFRRLSNPQTVVEVHSHEAPVHEVQITGKDVDLTKLPFFFSSRRRHTR